jgi:hypothetical protein
LRTRLLFVGKTSQIVTCSGDLTGGPQADR